MNLYGWLFILLGVFLGDILFNLYYVPRKPKGDYWKVIVFVIAGVIVSYFGLKVVSDWYRLPLLLFSPCVFYWQAKDSLLGAIWHRDLFYQSNHWPDSVIKRYLDGYQLAFIRLLAGLIGGIGLFYI